MPDSSIPIPISRGRVADMIAASRAPHPRIVATPARAEAVRDASAESAAGRFADAVIDTAEAVLHEPPVAYKKEGRRLLHVSRQALRRFVLLGIAWFRSGDSRFVRRAEVELRSVCGFPDWNPSHYLDVAEMALGVAFAYDWMHDELTAEAQRVAREALVRHAFDTAFSPADDSDGWGWATSHNNWCQVCHAGLTAAAVALADEEPDAALRIIHRAMNNIQLAGMSYAPDGDYPEGPVYWNYGTSFHVVFLETMRSAFGNDFGLGTMPGFMTSAASILHLTGPTEHLYGFADGSSAMRCFPTLLWFDAEGAVTLPADAPERCITDAAASPRDRLDPLAVFWADRVSRPGTESAIPLDHCGHGSQPVVTMRSAWGDPGAWFVGIKGGAPQGPHGHMDGGSFVLEAAGERWVLDLGAENYHHIESLGLNLWNMSQDSDRWRVFRLSTAAHSVLRINHAQQEAAGRADLIECTLADGSPSCRWDLTTLYPAAQRVERRFEFLERGGLCVTDLMKGLPAGTPVAWSFPTRAEATLVDGDSGTLRLHQHGLDLWVRVAEADRGEWQILEADTLLQPHDSPLPETRIVAWQTATPVTGVFTVQVSLELK